MAGTYELLVAEAERAAFSGWDFAWLRPRYVEPLPPWDYASELRGAMRDLGNMLDMGTGGGEVLASLAPLPALTVATEAWAPNLAVARGRLGPLGVGVVHVSESRLPFGPESFDLVANRHEEFEPGELFRVIRKGGTFITQQVGGLNNDEINQALQVPLHGAVSHPFPGWSLAEAERELQRAGFAVVRGLEATWPSYFYDVGAVVYFLKHAPWEIPDFDTKLYGEPLRELHRRIQRDGALKVTTSRFFVVARKQG